MILQELLVLEAVRGAGDHANTQRLDEYQHGHDRMWIAAVEYEDWLDSITINDAWELIEEQRVDVEANE